jgi:hypothetical protein
MTMNQSVFRFLDLFLETRHIYAEMFLRMKIVYTPGGKTKHKPKTCESGCKCTASLSSLKTRHFCYTP